ERLQKWQHGSPPGLASSERNLAGLEVDRAPGEPCQVAEPLSEIQSEKHEAAPFDIVTARFQDALDFRDCEGATLGVSITPDSFDARGRIHREQPLFDSRAKTDAQNFQAQVSRRVGKFLRLAIVEAFNVVIVQRAQIALAFLFAEKIEKPLNDALITRVRGLLRFDRLCFEPIVAPLADCL